MTVATAGKREARRPARMKRVEPARTWSDRGRADGSIVFRAVVRGLVEGAEGAEDRPGNKLSAVVFAALAGGRGDFVSEVLGNVSERANHAEFVAEHQRAGSLDFMREYSEALAQSFQAAADAFSTTSHATVGDFLASGDEADEARWRLALAFAEAELHEGQSEAPRGAPRYVVFQYCISVGILSFKRSSGVKVIQPGRSAAMAGLPYTLISLIAGWWGIPWGPIWTLETVARNLGGGTDVTSAMRSA